MGIFYDFLDSRVESKTTKAKLFLILNSIAFGLLGFLIYILVGRIILPGIDWMICFVGYPLVFVGLIGGTIYLFNKIKIRK